MADLLLWMMNRKKWVAGAWQDDWRVVDDGFGANNSCCVVLVVVFMFYVWLMLDGRLLFDVFVPVFSVSRAVPPHSHPPDRYFHWRR